MTSTLLTLLVLPSIYTWFAAPREEVAIYLMEELRDEKVKAYVHNTIVDKIIDCMIWHARTGEDHSGDGNVFVSELAKAMHIADRHETPGAGARAGFRRPAL